MYTFVCILFSCFDFPLFLILFLGLPRNNIFCIYLEYFAMTEKAANCAITVQLLQSVPRRNVLHLTADTACWIGCSIKDSPFPDRCLMTRGMRQKLTLPSHPSPAHRGRISFWRRPLWHRSMLSYCWKLQLMNCRKINFDCHFMPHWTSRFRTRLDPGPRLEPLF